MDEMLKPVATLMTWATRIITMEPIRPAWPTTHPKRMYIITPRMVRIEGVNTPAKNPNFCCPAKLVVSD